MKSETARLPRFFYYWMKIIPSFLIAALAHLALPVHAADACKYPVIAELPITFVGASLHPAIDGTIDGTPAGQEDVARQELMASAVANGRDLWPAQMVDFYLGKTDAAALLKTVNNDPGTANFRVCEGQYLMADWYHAHGNVAEETARRTAAKVACPARS